MTAYYNEIDPFAAQWLRNLIAAGHIAPGDVDTRSIEDVCPDDLRGYTQCHFFAGIGVWSHSLRRAGFPDSRPVWTASEPCQPFSAAGKGAGFADERYLRPAVQHLIRVCRPALIFGEQVASKDGLAWLDVIQADLEGEGYAFGAFDLCAAGFGAPHIRQRLYWSAASDLADTEGRGWGELWGSVEPGALRHADGGVRPLWLADPASGSVGPGLRDRGPTGLGRAEPADGGADGGLGHADGGLSELLAGERPGAIQAPGGRTCSESDGSGAARGLAVADEIERGRIAEPSGGDVGRGDAAGRQQGDGQPRPRCLICGLAEPDCAGCSRSGGSSPNDDRRNGEGLEQGRGAPSRSEALSSPGRLEGGRGGRDRPGPTNGRWALADWLLCRDAKWRPVEPGTFPLADGSPSRVGRLRAYGNAIVAAVAEGFISTYLEAEADGFSDPGAGGLGHNGGPALDDEDLIG